MASLRDIRKRIRAKKSMQQITKAMKMVAAAKLRKAQEAILAARPYAQSLDGLIADLGARVESVSHPLLVQRPPKNAELVVLTSYRGLAGGFNSNVIRRAQRFLVDNEKTYQSIRVSTIGRKGNDFFKKRNVKLRRNYTDLYTRVSFRTAADVSTELAGHFLSAEVDAVFLVYNEFISAISQKVSVVQLLPLPAPATAASAGASVPVDFKYEPDQQAVLERLVPQALAIKVYRALLESVASEQGARMSAMENATRNAGEMIGQLTLYYNRTRQAAITKELVEIVSGAEALK
ncbi:MAG TPA: ATP synthase F1 subunit gamma [Myxococcaceae bacterium]|nr:ATP synthase F1 subunit gamma [Myxococcaceae bacterium]